MTEPILPPLKPVPINDRISVAYVEKGNIDVLDGAFVVVDKNGVRTRIPVGGLVCIMLEPGTRVSHAAVTLASRVAVSLYGLAIAGYVSMLPVSPEEQEPTDSSTRQSWPSTTKHGLMLSGRCMR